jgi:hypothetical protein
MKIACGVTGYALMPNKGVKIALRIEPWLNGISGILSQNIIISPTIRIAFNQR